MPWVMLWVILWVMLWVMLGAPAKHRGQLRAIWTNAPRRGVRSR